MPLTSPEAVCITGEVTIKTTIQLLWLEARSKVTSKQVLTTILDRKSESYNNHHCYNRVRDDVVSSGLWYLREGVSDEGLHNLSPLISGQSLLQQLLLSHLPHSHLLADDCLLRPEMFDKLYTLVLILKKQHLQPEMQ